MKKNKLLIMEDTAALALDWRKAFELNGFEVDLATNGSDAIAMLEHRTYDLVITDLFVKSGRGGLSVIGKLAVMAKDVPLCIAITGYNTHPRSDQEMNHYLEQANRLGANMVLHKPIDPADLVIAAQSLLSS